MSKCPRALRLTVQQSHDLGIAFMAFPDCFQVASNENMEQAHVSVINVMIRHALVQTLEHEVPAWLAARRRE